MMVFVFVAAAFGGLWLILWNGYVGIEAERHAEAAKNAPDTLPPEPGCCVLCHAPLQTRRTSDDVVLALERRIEDDTASVMAILGRGAPAGDARVYRN